MADVDIAPNFGLELKVGQLCPHSFPSRDINSDSTGWLQNRQLLGREWNTVAG